MAKKKNLMPAVIDKEISVAFIKDCNSFHEFMEVRGNMSSKNIISRAYDRIKKYFKGDLNGKND